MSCDSQFFAVAECFFRGILLSLMCHFRMALLIMSAFFATTSVAQNADTPKPKQPVATVDGQPIYDEDLAPAVEGQLQPLRNQEYEIKRRALDGLIEERLL